MSRLLTEDPVALQVLMNETLFGTVEDIKKEMWSDHSFQQPSPQTITTPSEERESRTTAEEFIFRGAKEKGIVFILRYAERDYFSTGAQDAFEKILTAVGISPKEVAVVNLANAHNPNDFKRIMAFFKPTKIILLGVDPASLVLPAIPLNAYMKGKIATVFNTFSFEEMFVDIEKKKAFWQEFKRFLTD